MATKRVCLTCIHYDVVNFECSKLAEILKLSEPVQVNPDFGCEEHKSATAKNVIDKVKVTIDIGI